MQPNSKAKKTSLGFAVALTLLGMACGGPNDATPDFDCDAERLPGEYIRQNGGTYPARQLQERSSIVDGLDITTFGMIRADFNFWKETVDAVPFDPPANIVCEVLTFANADGARAFLAALEPNSESLATTSITWPLDAEFHVEEAALGEAPNFRAFVATHSGASPRSLVSLFEVEGSRVRAVHAGGKELQLTPGQLVPALRSITTVP